MTSPYAFEFGPYRLLVAERLLLRGGKSIPLAPKVFETLLAFVRNSGQLLSKDELMRLIWGDTIVEEGNLTQNIFVLRKMLGETPHDHRYLVTIPLQGYRFVAPIRELSASEARDQEESHRAGTRSIPNLATIAVLPFTVINASSEDQLEGLGIADTLITKLNNLKQLVVRPTTAVIKYASNKHDLIGLGKELEADSLLDGTIQRSGNRARVNVQMIEVATGRTVWAEKYDERYCDIFGVQDSIATKVAAALELRLTKDDVQRLTKSHTENLDAYQLYVKGRYFWDSRTEQGLKKALEYAQAAIQKDDNNAMAYVGVADSYSFLGEYLYASPDNSFRNAKAAALRARELDPQLAEAYASLGEISFFYDWNWEEAEGYYRQSFEMKPSYASAHHWYAWFLMAMGRFDEALASVRRAQAIDPGSLTLNTVLGLPFFYEGYYEQSLAQFRSTLEMDQSFAQAHYYLASTLVQLGRYDEAIEEFKTVRSAEYWQQSSALLCHAYARAGKRAEARAIIDELNGAAQQKYISPYLYATCYCGLDEPDKVLDYLETALNEQASWMVFLAIDPYLNKLRSEPRFKLLLQKLRLQTHTQ